MSVFLLSKGFCEKYERLIRDFWWGDEEGHRKVHWMSWERMIKPKRAGGIGFRDMHLFNQALLAKQGWRLIQNPDSLCARVLKSKYYPNGNLLDTVFASDVSPVWRAIESGLQLLKKGLIWRVGDGRSIQIQRDQWIPRKEGLKTVVFTKRSRLRWVNQLMNEEGKEWNVPLIRQMFHALDADEICRIPIPRAKAKDCVAWHYEKNGIFTVRSAYRLAASAIQAEQANPSSSTRDADDRSIWDLIWKAKVPGKIWIFGWRIATNTLATKKNKCKRTLEMDSTCNICGNGEEDEYHAVISCTKSRALREAMRKEWYLPAEKAFRYTGNDWLQVLLDSESEETRANILFLLWRCWHLREDCIRSSGKETIVGSVQFLARYSEEFKNATTMRDIDKGKSTGVSGVLGARHAQPINQWSGPPLGSAKLNTDASYMPDSGESAAGAVARDSKGHVFISVSQRMSPCRSVEEAEAKAALIGLNKLLRVYRGPLILELDSQVLANALKIGDYSRSPYYGLLIDIKEALNTFQSHSINCVGRSCNALAHGLAAVARSAGDQEMIADVPECLRQLMSSEFVATIE